MGREKLIQDCLQGILHQNPDILTAYWEERYKQYSVRIQIMPLFRKIQYFTYA